jgi:hypothetical protein
MAVQPKLVGIEGRNVVFDVGGVGIAVDPITKQTRQHSIIDVNGGAVLLPEGMGALAELAATAAEMINSEIAIVASAGEQRTFAVPRVVQKEVERALDWCFDHDDCSTVVGLSVANTLLAGGHVDVETVKHVNRYFSARDVDRKSAGWQPGGAEFPSPERVSWSLWGGDAGQRWAAKIIGATDTLVADAGVNLGLLTGEAGEHALWGQFDGPSMERVIALFAQRPDGGWLVWSNGDWAECDDPAGDPSLMYNPVCELDDDAAMYVAAALYDAPEMPVALSDIDPAEWAMMQELVFSIDDVLVDSVMTAAAPRPQRTADPSINHGDGVYTPEERSKNAKRQARDARGMFIQQGDRAMAGSTPVTVVGTRPSDGKVIVRGKSGTLYAVDGKQLKLDKKAGSKATTSGKRQTNAERYPDIAAYNKAADARRKADAIKKKKAADEARKDKAAVKAREDANTWRAERERRISGGTTYGRRVTGVRLPEYLSKILTKELHGMLNSYEERVRRAAEVAAAPAQSAKIAREARRREAAKIRAEDRAKAKEKARHDARYKHKKYPTQKKTTSIDDVLLAAAELPGGATEEVKPIYFAIVAKDDPQAVMELVAIAPEEEGSPTTTSFKRVSDEWVEDPAIIQDLKSPTPPPVVVLDGELFDNVLAQVDAAGDEPAPAEGEPAVTAAGGIPDKSNIVLVAVPAEGDPVWDASSEQVPHMTMLFFGKDVPPESLDVMHAAVAREAQELEPTTLDVVGREKLGDDEADVVMLDPGVFTWARDSLLEDPTVRSAYESTKQYPKWTPHLTLGYPPSPATGEPPSSITFDKLALWEGDYQGDEYLLGLRPDDDTVDVEGVDDEVMFASIQDIMLMPLWSVDNELLALVSAGGADRNRGNAERLRRYWTVGEGGAKIRWGTGGDWRRCVRHLSKYLGVRAKGYCSLRHREVTGMWTGDQLHRAMYGRK